MMDYKERYAAACGIYERSLIRIAEEPEPKGQKFPVGCRVRIADDLGRQKRHFKSGCNATVNHTYAHAYGGSNIDDYCLDIDDHCQVAWYQEHELTKIKE